MSVTLTPHLEAMIREKIETGLYRDEETVMREALRLLDEHDRRLQRLRAAIAVGDEQVARGDVVTWTPDFLDQLKREADDEDRLDLPINDDVVP